jgi:spore coat protein U-like protein
MMAARIVVVLMAMLGFTTGAEAACTLSASAVSFGTYDVFHAGPTDSTGTITFRCAANDKDIRIAISKGTSSTFSPRTLVSGLESLTYNVFFDPSYTQIWGDATGGTTTYFIRNPQNNRDIVLTMYARIPAGQDIPVGSYTDTLVVTLEY